LDYAKSNGNPTEQCLKLLDAAATVQHFLELKILELVEKYSERNGNLCLGGGVALNSKVNNKIMECGYNLYIPPSPTDAGSSIGAAILGLSESVKKISPSPYISYSARGEELEFIIHQARIACHKAVYIGNDTEVAKKTAEMLASGKIVGWFQSDAEWGPRALGTRSILANPALKQMKQLINSKVKFREPYRPFAPSTTSTKVTEYFVLDSEIALHSPYSYMLATCKVKEKWRERLKTVTHVDGTARIQIVWKDTNPTYYKLIESFGVITGFDVLVNTSFNISGEPTVSSPQDAYRTFLLSGLDALILGSYCITRNEN
jgi:carbamoyltransferase